MSPEDLQNYVRVMRENNVTAFKAGDISIELGAAPAQPLRPRDPDAPALPPKKNDYERMLFAATEGLPDEDE